MLSNIKSLETLKKIFSHMHRIHFLKLINYNKSIQSKLSVNLNSYKEYAKIYRVIDKDGKGKEFDISTNELKFEGEYKDKKRSGFGKEYEKGKLIYEGEYKGGLPNGYGKKYDEENGKLIFEGKFLNGKEWEGKGMVKEFNEDYGLLMIVDAYFYGEFKEGKVNGKGKMITKKISKYRYDYEGNFVKGLKSGLGKEYFDLENRKILVYDGEFKDDKRNGYGKEYKLGELIFEGQFLNGERWEGYGKEINNKFNEDKVDFEGEYKRGKRNGKGKEYFNNNALDLFRIKDFNENTIKFEGNYLDGEREGEGIEYFKNGKVSFKGEYTKGKKKNGKGFNIKGEVVYEIKDGEGNIKIFNMMDKLLYEGEYKNYQYWNGKQSSYHDNGKLQFEFFYTEGKIIYTKEYDRNEELILELNLKNEKCVTGKEYKNGEIIYEGEYETREKIEKKPTISNIIDREMSKSFGNISFESVLGRWARKGKEFYDNGNLKYDGEYFQGEKNGIGKEYNEEGRLIYEGGFQNGEKHGKGKIYDIRNNEEIDTEFFLGKENGISKTYRNGKLIKEIDYSKPEPIGKEYNEQGKIIFEGTFDRAGYRYTGNYKE